jgi:glutathione S-transferase
MRYELYYWDGIQGRGEFVRLALEDAGARYVDVARQEGGEDTMLELLDGRRVPRPSFAPPFLKAGRQLIGQTANILLYLGPRHGLAPASDAGRLWVHQLQLTIADLVAEGHDTHHPISSSLYYEDQRREAKRRATYFVGERIPKFLDYFERALERAPGRGPWLCGAKITYADLSLFQVVEGLSYAFPKTMARIARGHRRVVGVRDRVRDRRGWPRISLRRAVSRSTRAIPSGTTRRSTARSARPSAARVQTHRGRSVFIPDFSYSSDEPPRSSFAG